jgi:hypothetical protein
MGIAAPSLLPTTPFPNLKVIEGAYYETKEAEN